MNALTPMPLVKSEKIVPIEDGEETIRIRVTEYFNRRFRAVDRDRPDLAEGFGDTELSAMCDLFKKLPAAVSDREERDMQAERWDHRRDLVKHQ